MAKLTEKTNTQHKKHDKPKNPTTLTSPNPFAFWFYLTLIVSLITLASLSLSSHKTPNSHFLSLPLSLRQHYFNGRTLKIQTPFFKLPLDVFTIDNGHKSTETVVLVHGFGLSSYSFRKVSNFLADHGIRAVSIDLPGNGFSEKSSIMMEKRERTGLWGVYEEIKEKGLFWGFDRLVETGEMPYDEIKKRVTEVEVRKIVELGSYEMGNVLRDVVSSLGLGPVHLVLHDSALGIGGANWVSRSAGSGLVRSVSLVDTGVRGIGALPLWVLEVPFVRDVVLGVNFIYSRVVKMCCSKGIDEGLDAHRLLLRGRDVRRAVVGMGKRVNCSFDLAEWGASDGVKDVPMQVIWSGGWSEEWSKEGRRVAEALPKAKFVTHSGGRWPQDDAADELAHNIAQFVSSLPKTERPVEEEPLPEHIQKMIEEAKVNGHHHHGHEHEDAAGYIDAYGLGHGWGS